MRVNRVSALAATCGIALMLVAAPRNVHADLIAITIDDGTLETLVLAPTSDQDTSVPSFAANGATLQAMTALASAEATYQFINMNGQAIFGAEYSLSLDPPVGPNSAQDAVALLVMEFTLSETVNYLVEGQFTGTNTDDEDFAELNVFLVGTSPSTERHLRKFGTDGSPNFSLDYTNPDIGSLSGVLAPGSYLFSANAALDGGRFVASSSGQQGSGFYQLTLTSQDAAVPEPSSLVLLGTGALSLLCYRGRRRRNRNGVSQPESEPPCGP